MFYEDLSPYAYWEEDVFSDSLDSFRFVNFRPAYGRLNVGWLESGHPWARGHVPEEFVARLLAIIKTQQVNEMMGHHECDLCSTPLPDRHPWYVPRPGQRHPAAGTGEIRVPGIPGTTFAAPALIAHYVVDHGYLPPQPFLDAVLDFDPYGAWPVKFPGVRFPWIPDDAPLLHVDDGC